MSDLQVYLLVAPLVLLALGWAAAWWWVRQANGHSAAGPRAPRKGPQTAQPRDRQGSERVTGRPAVVLIPRGRVAGYSSPGV